MGNRDALLAAARRCLQDKGYARTTARDLVAVSQTNLASIGYHFGSKEALLNEAIRAGFRDWCEGLAALARADEGLSPLERLTTAWRLMLDDFDAQRPLLVAFAEAMAQATRNPGLRRALAEIYAENRARIADHFRAVVGEELPPGSPAPEVIASVTMALCDGFALQWLVDPDHTLGGTALVDGLAAAAAVLVPEAGSGRGAT